MNLQHVFESDRQSNFMVPVQGGTTFHAGHSCPSTSTEAITPGYCGLPLEILPLTSNCFKFGKHPCSKFDEYYDLHTLPCSDAIQQHILISSGVWDLSCEF